LSIHQGADDEYGTIRQVETTPSSIHGPCETLILDACGHSPHIDQRAIVEKVMADFVSRVRS
jgi:pimeloyl-ACP methyl ester carboxylesterase